MSFAFRTETEKHEKLIQFLRFLEQYTKDTQDYLQHTTQAEKQVALQQQLDTIEMIIRKFQQLFFRQETPELPFEEEKAEP